jgi:hypothetical protein
MGRSAGIHLARGLEVGRCCLQYLTQADWRWCASSVLCVEVEANCLAMMARCASSLRVDVEGAGRLWETMTKDSQPQVRTRSANLVPSGSNVLFLSSSRHTPCNTPQNTMDRALFRSILGSSNIGHTKPRLALSGKPDYLSMDKTGKILSSSKSLFAQPEFVQASPRLRQ